MISSYLSIKNFLLAKQNNNIYDKKILAIVVSLKT